MANILIGYGSLTGNTQSVAEKLTDLLRTHRHTVTLKNLAEVSPAELATFEILLLGSSTWDDGQLPFDTQAFVDQCATQFITLAQTRCAVFGCGDISYDHTYCVAVDMLGQLLTTRGSQLLCTDLKIDGFPESPENRELFTQWATQLVALLVT